MISETMNPFGQDIDESHLYNIATGKASQVETQEFLLSVKEFGKNLRLKFTQECNKKPDRFEERIQRNKLHTFQTIGDDI